MKPCPSVDDQLKCVTFLPGSNVFRWSPSTQFVSTLGHAILQLHGGSAAVDKSPLVDCILSVTLLSSVPYTARCLLCCMLCASASCRTAALRNDDVLPSLKKLSHWLCWETPASGSIASHLFSMQFAIKSLYFRLFLWCASLAVVFSWFCQLYCYN